MQYKNSDSPSEKTEPSLSLIILTYNEENNIEACLKSIHGLVKDIFIVDSYSTDKTLEIVKGYTDKVYQHPFENQAKQLNWALTNLPIKTEWIMRLDADERVTRELRDELLQELPGIKGEIAGLYVKRRVYFWGRWIRHGGYYPTWLLRIWKNGKAYCEERWMDEHMKLTEGRALFLKDDIIEENTKYLHWWIGKHNNYATREALEILNLKHHFFNCDSVPRNIFGTQEQRKRWIKERLYARMPLYIRPFFYFVYRYFFQLGFLDGREGLVWHFLQGFWYRFLVDAKIDEIGGKAKKEGRDTKEVIKEFYKIDL